MTRLRILKSALIGGASALTLAGPAAAKVFDIPNGDLAAALDAYMRQAGVQIAYSDDVVRGHKSQGAKGDYTETAALTEILRGSGFTARAMPANIIGIVPAPRESKPRAETIELAAATPRAPAPAAIETVVVTAQHKSENIQNVPIAVTALSQSQLTDRQIAGGPDLLRDVPNMDFTKTNFSGYNIELRGIGTQAISVTTDPAVAVAFNDTPFIRNHFFEQEFYDLQDVEVLRGPQGTLYGRNATAGVVNLKSALPTDSYEAMVSADIGNFSNRRLEAMVNIPIVGDKLDLRLAGEWTRRDGYSFNTITGQPIDGRDLWSTRLTIGWKPRSDIQTYFVWEHFSEDDDRLRSGKQLCKSAPTPTEIDGVSVQANNFRVENPNLEPSNYLSQGCEMTSLYSPGAFQTPNAFALPYATDLAVLDNFIRPSYNPYVSTTQSTDLRVIDSALNPTYRAKNDTLEFNVSYDVTDALTLTSQTGYNNDFLYSAEDYNRFNTAPGFFYMGAFTDNPWQTNSVSPDPSGLYHCASAYGGSDCNTVAGAPCTPNGFLGDQCIRDAIFCDPQLGCSGRLVAEDLSEERAWQFSQEVRLSSKFNGPLNFSAGGNFLHYETVEDYYVFINSVTSGAADNVGGSPSNPAMQAQWIPGVSDNSQCLNHGFSYPLPSGLHNPLNAGYCAYIDPNPLASLNNEGHNYFLSQNPYVLNSYAAFGEAYYNFTSDLKLTLGARWTDDQKHFIDIPSELLVPGYGYPSTGVVDQQWNQWTGRAAIDWTPKLDFTDQTLVYGSFAHGYKAGGANPPGAVLLTYGNGDIANPIHPLIFKPEFIEAFEFGSKNTLLDGSLTLNGDIFYYAYRNYQISEIVDRTAINNNYNAAVKGAELESNWEPLPGLKFGLTAGYENATADNGDTGIDLMDRTAGNPNWMVLKNFPTQASNCIVPNYVLAAILEPPGTVHGIAYLCGTAYTLHQDPLTDLPYVQNPSVDQSSAGIPPGYPGYDPLSVDPNAPANVNNGLGLPPNNGEGFSKNLGGNQLPNAPHFTTSLTAEYSMPVSDDWIGTLHADFYWQSQSWARIFNDPIDKLHGYSNVNLSLILTSGNGWQVMGYVKNLFDVTAITGTFLNSDDSGLTTNIFLTDPRLFGVRVTKQLDQNDGFWGSDYSGYDFFTGLFSDADNGRPPLWVEVGGNFDQLRADHQLFDPPFLASIPSGYGSQLSPQKAPALGLDWEAKLSFEPNDSDWVFSAGARYGRAHGNRNLHEQTNLSKTFVGAVVPFQYQPRYSDAQFSNSESHAMLDFLAGKSVGLGMLGLPGSAVLSGGARYAAFASKSSMLIHSSPDDALRTNGPKYRYHRYAGKFDAVRSFHGIGPAVDLNASTPFLGNEQDGEIALDWGANGAVLFGRQRAGGRHSTGGNYYCYSGFGGAFVGRTGCPANFRVYNTKFYHTGYQRTKSFNRSRMVTVPNIGAFVGLSMKYQNAKVSFGYRVDEFFGAMDGGIDTRKSENMGFFGPYANISIGVGG